MAWAFFGTKGPMNKQLRTRKVYGGSPWRRFKRVRIFELRTQPKWKARGQEEPTEHEMPSKEAPRKLEVTVTWGVDLPHEPPLMQLI